MRLARARTCWQYAQPPLVAMTPRGFRAGMIVTSAGPASTVRSGRLGGDVQPPDANRDGGDPAEQRDRQPRQERRSGHDRTSGSLSTVNRSEVELALPAMSLAVTTSS